MDTSFCRGGRWLPRLLLGVWLALSGAAAQEPRPADRPAVGPRAIRIATEGAFPPFNYMEGAEPQGFEIDLGKALCEAMRAACTFVTHEWDGIIRGLLAKDYDAVMASLAITERRKARIAFSKRYYFIPPAFIARKETEIADASPAALAGKAIGTIEGSQHAAFLKARHPEANLRTYAKLDEAELDLLTERIDLVLGDKLALSRFLQSREGGCCRFAGEPAVDAAFYGEGVAVGLRKEDKELKELFNQALERIKADGTYDRIRAKYFAFDTK